MTPEATRLAVMATLTSERTPMAPHKARAAAIGALAIMAMVLAAAPATSAAAVGDGGGGGGGSGGGSGGGGGGGEDEPCDGVSGQVGLLHVQFENALVGEAVCSIGVVDGDDSSGYCGDGSLIPDESCKACTPGPTGACLYVRARIFYAYDTFGDRCGSPGKLCVRGMGEAYGRNDLSPTQVHLGVSTERGGGAGSFFSATCFTAPASFLLVINNDCWARAGGSAYVPAEGGYCVTASASMNLDYTTANAPPPVQHRVCA